MGREIDAQKQQRLKEKLAKRREKDGFDRATFEDVTTPIHCACLIHSDGYTWDYVDRLYNMISRNMSRPIIMHVYTEDSRAVPTPYVKHSLIDWGISGPKRSWWYKLQILNSEHHAGPLLYFDLDTVITGNIDWIWRLPLTNFWTVRDFKYLWRPNYNGSNSSVMWWNTVKYEYLWDEVKKSKIADFFKKYHGDQDFITEKIPLKDRRFLNTDWVKSWRWQCLDGGYNFSRRIHLAPGTGTTVDKNTSILVFHGNPKPSEIVDPVVSAHWR